MSNNRNPENLISGYLDDQLTPDERRQVDDMLRDDPVMRELYDSLKTQTASFAALPKFRLGNDFSDRILADKRVSKLFSDADSKPSSADSTSVSQNLNFKTAIAAIASLAALVLITLFLPLMEAETASVAQFKPDSAVVEVDEAPAEDVAGKSGVFKRNSKTAENDLNEMSDFVQPANEEVDGVVLGAAKQPGGVQPKMLMESRGQNAAVFDDSDRFSKQARAQTTRQEKQLVDNQSAESVTRVEGSRKMVPAQDATPFFEMKQDVARDKKSGLVEKSAPIESGVASRGFGQQAELEDSPKLATDVQNRLADSPGRVARAVPGMDGQIELDDQLSGDTLGVAFESNVLQLSTVVEIAYDGGPEMLGELQKSMARNSIAFVVPEERKDSPNLMAMRNDRRGAFGQGGGVGGGGGAKAGTFDKDLERGARSGAEPPRSHATQAFLITATPKQMVRLVEDVQENATVATIQLNPAVVKGSVNRQRIDAAKRFQAELLAGVGDDDAAQPAKSQDAEIDQPLPSQLGVNAIQNNELGADANIQGLATQLPLNFGIEKDADELRKELGQFGQSMGRRADSLNLKSSSDEELQRDGGGQDSQQTLRKANKSLAPKRSRDQQLRSYLLVIRTKESSAMSVPGAAEPDASVSPAAKNK